METTSATDNSVTHRETDERHSCDTLFAVV